MFAMPTEDIRERTRREWRELGFFAECNDKAKVWRLVGSRSGLLRFRDVLVEYADDPSNDYKSEHEHYGPYFFEIMTWNEPGFDDHSIHGSLADLKRLAVIVENKLARAQADDSVCIQYEFAANTPYALILEVREDGFDPSQADPTLSKEAV
jgi:hypothetical protein